MSRAYERALLEAALARADADLSVASAGRALCRIDGSGGPTPFWVKRAEGARAALGDVRRRLRRGPELTVRECATSALTSWQEDLARWREKGSAPWAAYCEGGCESLGDLLGPLSTADATPPPAAEPASRPERGG